MSPRRPEPAEVRGSFQATVKAIRAAEDDEDALAELGIGPLEGLLFAHESELWDDIEREARSSPAFRRALRSVWAYQSERYDKRQALLRELDELRPVTLRVDTYAESSGALTWKNLAIDGLSTAELVPLLRGLADALEMGGPAIEEFPATAVRLTVPTDVEDIRPQIERALTEAELEILPPTGWEAAAAARGSRIGGHILIRLRHTTKPEGPEPIAAWPRVQAAIPGIWAAMATRGATATWCFLDVQVVTPVPPDAAWPTRPKVRATHWVFGQRPAGDGILTTDQLTKAIAEMDPDPQDGGRPFRYLLPDGTWRDSAED